MKTSVFWNTPSCSLVQTYQRFQERATYVLEQKNAVPVQRRWDPPKRWEVAFRLHGVVLQKIAIFRLLLLLQFLELQAALGKAG
jgi:hypothetical protein